MHRRAPHHVLNEAAHKLPRALDDPGDLAVASAPATRKEPRERASDAAPGSAADGDVVVNGSRAILALGALGVVYGDIGTSPLYTEQVTFGFEAARRVGTAGVYGVISLIFWALAIVVSIKYSGLIMRAHNRGDGGIMALAVLVRRHRIRHATALVTLGIFGAALFFGDGMITPAVSVLSAVSGLEIATPSVAHLVVPITIVILLALFLLQHRGTGTVGWLFGPVMLLWFASLAAIGIPGVLAHPTVLQAFSPIWAIRFFAAHGIQAFVALGGVVLCTTGAEALYADRGHFGPGAIRLAWFGVVWPAVLLDYLAQAGWILDHRGAPLHTATFNPFFSVVPSGLRLPEVMLATAAAVIASEAVISGSYSVARQALQLGYLPRMRIFHTSNLEGQIYVPSINWILAAGVIILVIIFKTADGLANAYGLAVTGTFVLNTVLFLSLARGWWQLARVKVALLGVLFLGVELPFFVANLAKLLHGAWVPLAIGAAVSIVMITWRAGQVIVTRNRRAQEGGLDEFLYRLGDIRPPVRRVPGTAVFLNPSTETTPLALRSVVEQAYALPEKVVLVSVVDASVPHVGREHRFDVRYMGRGAYKVTHVSICNGYRDANSVPDALKLARKLGHLERSLDLEDASYFISKITIAQTRDRGMARWQKRLFLGMARNATSPIEHFGLPIKKTVIMGSEISL